MAQRRKGALVLVAWRAYPTKGPINLFEATHVGGMDQPINDISVSLTKHDVNCDSLLRTEAVTLSYLLSPSSRCSAWLCWMPSWATVDPIPTKSQQMWSHANQSTS
jgi:hypothetical protein